MPARGDVKKKKTFLFYDDLHCVVVFDVTHPGPVAGEAAGATGGVLARVELLGLVAAGLIRAEGRRAGGRHGGRRKKTGGGI
jgi:hypothetical protein